MSMTRAFAARAAWMVGNAARILASLVTAPSLTGTFRSSRINTRFADRSRFVILLIFMIHLRRVPPRLKATLPRPRARRSAGLRPGEGGIEHPIGKAPLIVVPGAQLHHRA